MLTLLLALAQATTPVPAADGAAPSPTLQAEPLAPPVDHVLLISVDGLRGDVLGMDTLDLPNFRRLREGASTLEARCDPAYSVTLPNHAGMFTGRTVRGRAGHGWSGNAIPPPDARLIDADGTPIQGLFHVLTRNGVANAMIASKEKFVLFPQSWNRPGAEPALQRYRFKKEPTRQIELALEMLDPERHPRSFVFLHLRAPDDFGHDHGWDLTPGSPYLKAIAWVDKHLGQVLDGIEADPVLKARTAIVLTSDHGGGIPYRNHHGMGMFRVNTAVPFLVLAPGLERSDLYDLLPGRKPPGLDPIADGLEFPPVRNLDAANLCLGLMGLGPVPGSTVDPEQTLATALRRAAVLPKRP